MVMNVPELNLNGQSARQNNFGFTTLALMFMGSVAEMQHSFLFWVFSRQCRIGTNGTTGTKDTTDTKDTNGTKGTTDTNEH